VRRSLSILLLAIFGLPFVAPLLAMGTAKDANLPACCRRDGKHHCMLGMTASGQAVSHDPAFQAPVEKCPYCPAVVVVDSGNTLAAPTAAAIFTGRTIRIAGIARAGSKLRSVSHRAHPQRGPPTPISL
jgi:hypothetical protein